MSRIVKVAGWSGKSRASVIFVHGLGGDAYDTWRRAPDDNSFWPPWLAEDIAGLAVYTLAYEAPASNWLGTAMPLQDRAVNILEILLGTPGLTEGPVIFICHSLGGLIVKQLLLDLDRQKGRRPEAAALLNCVTQVVFLATPHTGSRQGSLLDRLRFLAWPTSIARTLVANDPTLRSINVDNRGLADERRNTLHHLIFYETEGRRPASSSTRRAPIRDCPAVLRSRSMPITSRSSSRPTGLRCSTRAPVILSRKGYPPSPAMARSKPFRCRR